MREATTASATHPLSLGQCATLACLLEVTAPKPGNVHRAADFQDLTFLDFQVSATLIGPSIAQSAARGIGRTVLESVQATRHWTATNSNLGTILLLAPLAATAPDQPISAGIGATLDGLTAEDSRLVYEAIRLARPGGMGRVERLDLADEPPADLLAAMRFAAPHDLVARQYVDEFATVLSVVVPSLADAVADGLTLTDSIVHTQMRLMAQWPDSLIARKCGERVAADSAHLAQRVLDAGPPGSQDYLRELSSLDFWLRSDGHRRNPGTTADLIAAGLFVALREQRLTPPFR